MSPEVLEPLGYRPSLDSRDDVSVMQDRVDVYIEDEARTNVTLR